MAHTRDYFSGSIRAPFGEIVVIASDLGVHNIMFDPDGTPKGVLADSLTHKPSHPVVARTISQLREYFAGTRTEFDLPLDLEGTEFQVAAWNALAKVKYGRTSSYARQAASIGRPTATRAVGAANGRNPVAIVLPCHRIVGADGSLTGFAGGLGVKKWLLRHEQDVVAGIKPRQATRKGRT